MLRCASACAFLACLAGALAGGNGHNGLCAPRSHAIAGIEEELVVLARDFLHVLVSLDMTQFRAVTVPSMVMCADVSKIGNLGCFPDRDHVEVGV